MTQLPCVLVLLDNYYKNSSNISSDANDRTNELWNVTGSNRNICLSGAQRVCWEAEPDSYIVAIVKRLGARHRMRC